MRLSSGTRPTRFSARASTSLIPRRSMSRSRSSSIRASRTTSSTRLSRVRRSRRLPKRASRTLRLWPLSGRWRKSSATSPLVCTALPSRLPPKTAIALLARSRSMLISSRRTAARFHSAPSILRTTLTELTVASTSLMTALSSVSAP